MTTLADPAAVPPQRAAAQAPARAARDPRLDVFRGVAMFIILAAHTPRNFFSSWIPARWGFSDATEIFVFCSGAASAIAFGRAYERAGWRMGTARVGFRVWEVYWAHIALFFFTAAMLAAVDEAGWFPDTVYIGTLNLWRFFAEPGPQLVGLFTLTYVPNYFDILPMYLVILALMPLVMALSRAGFGAVAAASLLVWLVSQEALAETFGWPHNGLPAEPWSDRTWFFNPFAWQLIFFTGFAFSRGWLPAPPISRPLMIAAAAILLACVPVSHVGVRELDLEWARAWREANAALFDKSDFGVLRYLHFLVLAYLAWALAGEGGHRLRITGEGPLARAGRWLVAQITVVGQQSLAVFVFSMAFARLSGIVMDAVGRNTWNMTLANLVGFAALVLLAHTVAWFKSQPWKAQTPPPAQVRSAP